MKENLLTRKAPLRRFSVSVAPVRTWFPLLALLCFPAAAATQEAEALDAPSAEVAVAAAVAAQKPEPREAESTEVAAVSTVGGGPSSTSVGKATVDTPSVGRRIVDPSKFPPRQNPVARVLLAPFRALGPKLNLGLTAVEERNALERVRVILSNPYIHPLFGTLGDGSGFGGGVAFSTADSLTRNYQAFGNFHGTFKQYLEISGGLRADPTDGHYENFSLELTARYRRRPEEDFWGLGPNSLHSRRSSYNLEEPGVSATANFHLSKRARAGAVLDFSSARIRPGNDTDFPITQDLFAGTGLPGLFTGADLLGYGVFAELDLRDVVGNPRSGFYAFAGATSYDSVGDEDFGFWNYRFDARGYLPLGNKRRVLALRMLGEFNDAKGGSEIPFFRLARLGDTQTLRGYDTYRFHGRHALMGTAEYRYALSGGVEAFAFTDVGQVFDRGSEFNTDNLRVTYGGGLRFATARSLFLRLYAARGGERLRLFFSFGPSF